MLVGVIFAVALGIVGKYADTGQFLGAKQLSRLGGPWMLAAFIAGSICSYRSRSWGTLLASACAGAVAIALGSVLYYVIGGLVVHDISLLHGTALAVAWASAGVLVGAFAGALGGAVATKPVGVAAAKINLISGAATGTMAGLLLAESVALLRVWDAQGYRSMAILEAIGALAILGVASFGRPVKWAAAAAVTALTVGFFGQIFVVALRESLRWFGWHGT